MEILDLRNKSCGQEKPVPLDTVGPNLGINQSAFYRLQSDFFDNGFFQGLCLSNPLNDYQNLGAKAAGPRLLAEVSEDHETPLRPWSEESVTGYFENRLALLDSYISDPHLTLHERKIRFVTSKALNTFSGKRENALREKYHFNGAVFKAAGITNEGEDGSYIVKIGYLGSERLVPKELVLSVMSHEYGHTLPPSIRSNAVAEELKASAFELMFMRYTVIPDHRLNSNPEYPVHKAAKHILNDLLNVGVTFEQILAHLTGKKFGNASPNDYLRAERRPHAIYPEGLIIPAQPAIDIGREVKFEDFEAII